MSDIKEDSYDSPRKLPNAASVNKCALSLVRSLTGLNTIIDKADLPSDDGVWEFDMHQVMNGQNRVLRLTLEAFAWRPVEMGLAIPVTLGDIAQAEFEEMSPAAQWRFVRDLQEQLRRMEAYNDGEA